MVPIASYSAPFTVRPPTPPKETSGKQPNDTTLPGAFGSRPLLDTPEESPSSSAEYFNNSSEKRRKKVGFSVWPQYHRAAGSKGCDLDDSQRRSPPSKDCNPTKSILKPSGERPFVYDSNCVQPADTTSLPAMMRSVCLHLSSDSRPSRLDAYSSLLGCLSAYDDIPDIEELLENVREICGYMKRDIAAKLDDGKTDTQLVAQALKLTTVFFYTVGIEKILPEDFCSFILDQGLAILEDSQAPKVLVLHCMHLLEKQKFPARIFGAERQERLLSALTTITTRFKGNRIICHRLSIFQRLVTQARSLMINRCGKWMDLLATGLLSSNKDIRLRAISFGMEAGVQLGTSSSVSQECMNLCNRSPPEGDKFVTFFSRHLIDLAFSREDGQFVPQIWSVIVLMLRSRRPPLEKWEHLKTWLVVIQRCLNSSDPQIKFQANLAWDRFIFAVNLDDTTSSAMARMLRQPVSTQLTRKSEDKAAKMAKQIARSTYCTLLYYAFRPAVPFAQIDTYWHLYVSDIVPKCFMTSPTERNQALEILSALLFNDKQVKVWNENKAHLSGPTKPDDLPPLDPKWVRANSSRVLDVLDQLVGTTNWSTGTDIDMPVLNAWGHLMSALGQAGSKEIKTAQDAVVAVASILTWMKKILDLEQASDAQVESPFYKVEILLRQAVDKLGYLPFTEKRLAVDTNHVYEATIDTPSSRGSSRSTVADSAANLLTNLLLNTNHGPDSEGAYCNALSFVIQIHLHNTPSRQGRLKILRNLVQYLSTADLESDSSSSAIYWNLIAENAISALDLPRMSDSHNASPEYPGHEYRDVVKMLERGVQMHSDFVSNRLNQLYDQLNEVVSREISDLAATMVVQEPLSQILSVELTSECDDVTIDFSRRLLLKYQPPSSTRSLEKASLQLWGVPTNKTYDHLSRLLDNSLRLCYLYTKHLSETSVSSYLGSVDSIIQRWHASDLLKILGEIQSGLAVWIEDKDGTLKEPSALLVQVNGVCRKTMQSLKENKSHDSRALAEYETFIAALLSSRHRDILKAAIKWWNETWGRVPSLTYTELLQKSLLKIKDITVIQLPTFPAPDSQMSYSPIDFIESEELDNLAQFSPTKTRGVQSYSLPRPAFHRATPTPDVARSSRSTYSGRRSGKSTPKAKLKHDDSQIQFAAIESSPLVEETEQHDMLTDRQKEVRERQQVEAAMFPDIGSSPGVKPGDNKYGLPKLAFPNQQSGTRSCIDEDNSPTLPPDTIMNDFLGSSPTPSSSRRRSVEPFSDDGPPSSPPVLSSHLELGQLGKNPASFSDNQRKGATTADSNELVTMHDSPILPSSISLHLPTATADISLAKSSASQDFQSLRAGEDVLLDTGASFGAMEQVVESETDKESGKNKSSYHRADADAQVSFSNESPPIQSLENAPANEPVHVGEFGLRAPQVISLQAQVENDEVTKQIIKEMALASSQHSEVSSKSSDKRPSKPKRKRSSSENQEKREKKKRTSSKSRSSQQCSDESIAACVLVESSAAANNADRTWPSIKREESPSSESMIYFSNESSQAPEQGRNGSENHQSLMEEPAATSDIRHTSNEITENAEPRENQSRRRNTATTSWHTSEHPRSDHNSPLFELEVQADPRDIEAGRPTQSLTHNTDDERLEGRFTAKDIMERFRGAIDQIKQITLRPEEERAMSSLLFETVQHVHEAGRRHAAH